MRFGTSDFLERWMRKLQWMPFRSTVKNSKLLSVYCRVNTASLYLVLPPNVHAFNEIINMYEACKNLCPSSHFDSERFEILKLFFSQQAHMRVSTDYVKTYTDCTNSCGVDSFDLCFALPDISTFCPRFYVIVRKLKIPASIRNHIRVNSIRFIIFISLLSSS